MPSLATRRTIFKNIFKILAFLHLPPRSAHAETRGAFAAGAFGKLHHFVHGEQSAARNFGRVVRALRAVGAILRAASGFYGEQAAELDARRIVKLRGALAAQRKADRAAVAGRFGEFLRASNHAARPSLLPKLLHRCATKLLLQCENLFLRRLAIPSAIRVDSDWPGPKPRREKHSNAHWKRISTSAGH